MTPTTADRLAHPHDCATIQPGESEADWRQRTHGGQAPVEPGTCPTCVLTRGLACADIYWPWVGYDPHDKAEGPRSKPMSLAEMAEIAANALHLALDELADAEREVQDHRRWIEHVRAEVARVDGLLAGGNAT